MTVWTDTLLVFVLLGDFFLLGSSRIRASIRTVAAQGFFLGFLPLLVQQGAETPRALFLFAAGIGLRGVAFPWLLFRAQRAVMVRREAEPFVGFTASLLAGTLGLVLCFWLGARLPLPRPAASVSSLVVPVAFFSIFTGLFLIVGRKTALAQVLGYLVIENGIYAFGVSQALVEPLLVEMGILLDAFAAVFVMGITIFHISREFDNIDVDRLASLKDWEP